MPYPGYLSIARRAVDGVTKINKFGYNGSVGTTAAPVVTGGFYPTLQPSTATTVRVAAGNVNDAPAGTGARTVRVQGIDQNGDFASEDLATGGNSAGPASTTRFLRVFRAFVATCGSYNTPATGGHVGDIEIESSNGAISFATIPADGPIGLPTGQSLIGAYTIPRGFHAYITSLGVTANTGKTYDFELLQRQGILLEEAPFFARRSVEAYTGLTGDIEVPFASPLGPFPELTDLGIFARVGSQTGEIACSIDLLVVRGAAPPLAPEFQALEVIL